MANKKVTDSNNPLVDVHFKILRTEKDFLDNLGESASGFIRKLIDAQMSSHEVERAGTLEQLRQSEATTNLLKSRLSEFDELDRRKLAANKNHEQLIEDILGHLLGFTRVIRFKDTDFIRMFNNNLRSANQLLNGNGEPITRDELEKRIILEAEKRKVIVYV